MPRPTRPERRPEAPPEQPTDALTGDDADDWNSTRDGNHPPPARPATPVTTRPRLGRSGHGARRSPDPPPED